MTKQSLDIVELGKSLGEGCSGEVFEVLGQESDLVVKLFRSLSIDRNFLERNYARLRTAPEFHGTPAVYDHRFDRAPYAVLMERVEGVPLSKASSVKESVAWGIVRRLAETLGHAHKHGIYHGHLHPGNILLTGEGIGRVPVVTDFGSGLVGEIHHIDLGASAFFAAPEQLASGGVPWGEGRIQRWDVYGFGLVAFWLINERLPRGLRYIKEHNRLLAKAGGRPVPIDLGAYLKEIHDEPKYTWGSSFAHGREFRLCREVIDRCLALDPAERPVDLREVRNQFRSLEHRFALEEAEGRVLKERRKQRAKLFGARAVAVCMAVSLLAATHYLVDYLKKTYFFQNKVSELDQVVVTQRAQIHHLDERWADTVSDLKKSREAADSYFHRMAQGDNDGGTGVSSILREDLEKSREYYLKTLADVGQNEETLLERARALHSLAHIERKMALEDKAVEHFQNAVSAFEETLDRENLETRVDVVLRLADCHENLSNLLDNPIGSEALRSLENAVARFREAAGTRPHDGGILTRLAGISFKLGKVYELHLRMDEAIRAYSESAVIADSLREGADDFVPLSELIGKLQFHGASALRKAGRTEDSINAHIASMETLETLRGVNGFSALQSIQMAAGFLELGELFEQKGATIEDLDNLYNEALRLVAPLNSENPNDVEIAVLLCRSLGHIGELERVEGKWTSGYRMSIRGIEVLAEAIVETPGHIEGLLHLAEARLDHLKFLEREKKAAIRVAGEGVKTVEEARRLVVEEAAVEEPLLTRYRERLGALFHRYGEACEELGEKAISKHCRERSAMAITFHDAPADPEKLSE